MLAQELNTHISHVRIFHDFLFNHTQMYWKLRTVSIYYINKLGITDTR